MEGKVLSGKAVTTMCNKCIHKPVCSKYIATGGVNRCEHFKEERKGRWIVKNIKNSDYRLLLLRMRNRGQHSMEGLPGVYCGYER